LEALWALLIHNSKWYYKVKHKRSFFGLIDQQLRVDHLVELHSGDGLADLEGRHLDIQLGLVHEVADGEGGSDRLSVFAVEQRLAGGDLLVDLLIDVVEVHHHGHILVDWDVHPSLQVLLEVCHLLLYVVVDEVDQVYNPQITQLFLTVRGVYVSLNNQTITK
jgi:hypothetical protein